MERKGIAMETFRQYNGVMDFASIMEQISTQKQSAQMIIDRAQKGEIDEDEAATILAEIKKATSSLKATVAVFIEMHKDSSIGEKKTLSDAIEKLDTMSNKFNGVHKLK